MQICIITYLNLCLNLIFLCIILFFLTVKTILNCIGCLFRIKKCALCLKNLIHFILCDEIKKYIKNNIKNNVEVSYKFQNHYANYNNNVITNSTQVNSVNYGILRIISGLRL